MMQRQERSYIKTKTLSISSQALGQMEIKNCHICKIQPKLESGFFQSPNPEFKNSDGTFRTFPINWIECPTCHQTMRDFNVDELCKRWNYWNTHFFYLEDVHSLGLDALELIETVLKEKFEIELTDEQSDEIYVPIKQVLEKLSNGEYRSHM